MNNPQNLQNFWNTLNDNEKQQLFAIAEKWNDSRLHVERQNAVRDHYQGRVGDEELEDLVASTPYNCENCGSNSYHIDSYTDGDDVVCGQCNGTAYRDPSYW